MKILQKNELVQMTEEDLKEIMSELGIIRLEYIFRVINAIRPLKNNSTNQMQPLQEKEQQSNTLVESHVKINTLQEIEMLGNSSVSSQMESTCINFGYSLQDSCKVCAKKNSKDPCQVDTLQVSVCETNYYSEPLFQTSVCWSVCVELRKSTNPMHICSLCKLPLS